MLQHAMNPPVPPLRRLANGDIPPTFAIEAIEQLAREHGLTISPIPVQPDGVSVLITTDRGRRCTKTFQPNADGTYTKITTDNALRYSAAEIGFASFRDFTHLLTLLEGIPNACLVRGTAGHSRGPWSVNFRRMRIHHPDDGIYEDAPRTTLHLDIDDAALARQVDLVNEPHAAVDLVLAGLPEYMRKASCWWQYSSSAGTAGTFTDVVRLHLWFLLDTPLTSAEVGVFLDGLHAHGVDPAVGRVVQPNFVANPVFTDGRDPLPVRSGVIIGETERIQLPASALAYIRSRPKAGRQKAQRTTKRRAAAQETQEAAEDTPAHGLTPSPVIEAVSFAATLQCFGNGGGRGRTVVKAAICRWPGRRDAEGREHVRHKLEEALVATPDLTAERRQQIASYMTDPHFADLWKWFGEAEERENPFSRLAPGAAIRIEVPSWVARRP